MQPHKFLDEIAFENAGNDGEKLREAEKLAVERRRKSRYIVFDLETYALNQATGMGRQVPHVLVAATVCYQCLGSHFRQQKCDHCNGSHHSNLCLSNEEWRLDNTECKVSTWANEAPCLECEQQQIVIRSGSERDLWDHFCNWMFRDSMQGFNLVAHNGASFDNPYLLQYLINVRGLFVEPIYSGSKLLQFLIKLKEDSNRYFIRVIDSVQFFQSALSALPKQFGLDTTDLKKGIFPYKFDKPTNWNYVGPFPDLLYYAPREKRSGSAKEIEAWHPQQQGKVFHFRREMLDYCLEDVRVLVSAIQVAVKEDLEMMGFDGMAETCTIAAKTMMFFRYKFLKPRTIGIIPQNGHIGHRNQSIEGLMWLLLQEAEHYPGLQHARSTHGEKTVCGIPVDGFHAESKTVLQFHGCFFHGCRVCYENGALFNNVSGESFETLRTKTAMRTQKMREAGYRVVEKWSCQWTADELQRAKDLGIDKNVPQLVPKDAFFGGRTEALKLSLSTKDCGRDILYYDVTSEYPFVNARKQYPVGHPVAMLKHECPQSNETWKKANLFGNVRCSILPPGQLLHPVLPYRQNGALMFPLCHTCCREKRESFCPHSDVERTLHGTWPTIEIDRAVELGYTIVRVEEVAHFNRRSSDLFKNFIYCLYKNKLEAS